jgi:thioredoxin-related protein
MQEIVTRLGILLLTCVVAWLLIQLCRRFIETQRQQALAAAPLRTLAAPYNNVDNAVSEQPEAIDHSHIHILAFSSADCHQCHRLQAPALQRVVEARGDTVTVVDVDATTEHDLVQTYHIMTVPSTVILDATGQAQAINYGFAHTQRLLTQIDKVLAQRA